MKTKIGIIGGGASGMMAAIFAASEDTQVTILEHSPRIGKKILSTGNGKCNFTNRKLSKDDYYGNHPSFVASALQRFDNQSAVAFFERCGMLTTQKRDGYFYPYSMQASAVLDTLRRMLERQDVCVLTEQKILFASKRGERFLVRCPQGEMAFDRLILACGGNAAPQTGSDGSGYQLAKAFGHTIQKPLPVLTFLCCTDPLLRELAGVRCNAQLTLVADGKRLCEEEGELQLNKENLSGIPVFQLSHAAILALEQKKDTRIRVDFLPGYAADEVESLLLGLRLQYPFVPIQEALGGLLHKKVCGALLRRAGIAFHTNTADLKGRELQRLISCIQGLEFKIDGHPRFENAQATMGGVSIDEMDENMMSRKVENLYFAGEIMDVDGRCGGYNLQWAWTSGYIAGLHSRNGEVKCYE